MSGTLNLRPFTPADIPAMTAIYAHYVANSTVTFDTEAPTEKAMEEKFTAMAALGHPIIIAEKDGKVLGYAYASTYRPRHAYRFTCEDTLYLSPDATGQGIGSLLLEKLIEQSRAFGFKQMIGVIEAGADPSIALHKKFGFEIVGRHKDLGFKFDRWLSIVHMQLSL
jgi:L-amino acid N-acyltransferase YncA